MLQWSSIPTWHNQEELSKRCPCRNSMKLEPNPPVPFLMCVSLILRLRINCHFSFLHLEKCFSGSVSQSQVREVCLLQLIDFTYFYLHGYNLLKGFSLMAQTVKNSPTMWDPSLGWEDPLEESMATHSSILAWRIPMKRRAWRATVHEVTKSLT